MISAVLKKFQIVFLKIRSTPATIGLTIWILLLTGSLAVWLWLDTKPPHWDMSNHLLNALAYADNTIKLRQMDSIASIGRALIERILISYHYYPPFLYWTTLPISIFLRSADALTLINSIYIFIFAISLFGLARKFVGPGLALLTVLIGTTLPFFISQTHQYQLDFPLTSLVTAGLYFLLSSEYFSHRYSSLWFGVVTGLTMLLKWPALAFFILPAGVSLILGFIRLPGMRKTILTNTLLSFLIFLVIVQPWYFMNFEALVRDFRGTLQSGINEGDPPPLSWPSFWWYLQVFPFEYIRGLLLPFFVIGLSYVFMRARQDDRLVILLTHVVGTYIIFTLFQNKDARFIMPLIGAATIFMIIWLPTLSERWRLSLVGYLTAVALFHFATINFGIPWLPTEWRIKLPVDYPKTLKADQPLKIYSQLGYFSGPPTDELWPNQMILADINADAQLTGRIGYTIAMIYHDNPYFNKENFTFYLNQDRLNGRVTYPFPPHNFSCMNDYLIYLENDQEIRSTYSDNRFRYSDVECAVRVINTYDVPGGWKATTFSLEH